jgi:hypothetical protein
MARGFLRLLFRVAGLPLAGQLALVLAMYLSKGRLGEALALIFVLASVVGIFIWVGRSILAHVERFYRGEVPSGEGLEVLSMVFYTLVVGYLALALAFALAYDAQECTTAEGFLENAYFSLTTLTTVGYGDISPHGSGRLIACVEMIAGLSYQVLAIGGGSASGGAGMSTADDGLLRRMRPTPIATRRSPRVVNHKGWCAGGSKRSVAVKPSM